MGRGPRFRFRFIVLTVEAFQGLESQVKCDPGGHDLVPKLSYLGIHSVCILRARFHQLLFADSWERASMIRSEEYDCQLSRSLYTLVKLGGVGSLKGFGFRLHASHSFSLSRGPTYALQLRSFG